MKVLIIGDAHYSSSISKELLKKLKEIENIEIVENPTIEELKLTIPETLSIDDFCIMKEDKKLFDYNH